MKVIKPPHLISTVGANIPAIFLAGSIEMGTAEDWQTTVENYFKYYAKEVVILNPRRDAWDSSWSQDALCPQFYQQVNWELNALEKADMIIMYFSPDTKSPISLLELGKFADSGKIEQYAARLDFGKKATLIFFASDMVFQITQASMNY